MAAVRKGQASLGTFGYRLRSIRSPFEKVSWRRQPDPPGNLGQYDIQIKDDHKLCQALLSLLLIAHAKHASNSVFIYLSVCLLEAGGWGFLKNWLPPDSRCPPPSVPPSPSLISASPAVRTTWPPENHQHHQQLCRDPPTPPTELFRVPLAGLWPMVGRSWQSTGKYRNWALCNSGLYRSSQWAVFHVRICSIKQTQFENNYNLGWAVPKSFMILMFVRAIISDITVKPVPTDYTIRSAKQHQISQVNNGQTAAPCLRFCVKPQEASPNKAHASFVFHKQLLVLTSAPPFSSTAIMNECLMTLQVHYLPHLRLCWATLIDLCAELKLFIVLHYNVWTVCGDLGGSSDYYLSDKHWGLTTGVHASASGPSVDSNVTNCTYLLCSERYSWGVISDQF